MESFEFIVEPRYEGRRVDVFLAESLGGRFSRGEIQTAVTAGAVTLNGKPAKSSTSLKAGDRVQGALEPKARGAMRAESRALNVLYEDEFLMVIDKPAGLVVHPGAGNREGTLVNALLGRGGALSDASGPLRPGIVHRLDKNTSGVLLVAKTNEAHRKLQSQFAERSIKKTYSALVKGRIEFEEGRIEAPIGYHPKIREKMAVSRAVLAREAETHYRVVERFKHATLLSVRLVTGRTHQIRVHMAHLGHPVFGDSTYGSSSESGRLGLHAQRIEFVHPQTGKVIEFESPLPEDYRQLIERARVS